MLEFLLINFFRLLYCAGGAYFIECALNRYEKKHYILVGLNIMFAIWMAGMLFKTLV